MRIDGVDFKRRGGKVTIENGGSNYGMVVYPDTPPVCKRAEDFFALRDGRRLVIDKNFIRHEAAPVRMIIAVHRARLLRLVEFQATVLQKQVGALQTGIIIDHPLFNGLMCWPDWESPLWYVLRPFRMRNCSPVGDPFYAGVVDGPAFHKKYIETHYNFPETPIDSQEHLRIHIAFSKFDDSYF